MKHYLSKIKTDKLTRDNFLLCMLICLLSLTPLLGLGFKNTILSSLFLISYILIANPIFDYSNSKNTKLLFCFLTVFSITMFFRQTPYGFHEFINLGLGGLLCINLLNQQIQTQKISKVIIFITAILSVFSIATLYLTGADRAFGTFFGADPYTYYPNAFSNLLLVAITLASNLLLNTKLNNIIKEKHLIFAIFVSLIGFWATFSRGAYLSLAIAMAILISIHFFTDKKNLTNTFKKAFILLSISILALLTSTSLSNLSEYGSDFADRVQTSDVSSIKSANERPLLWSGALHIFKEYPLVGSGSGSFQFVYPKHQTELLSNAPHPHNFLLKLLSENGIFVATLFFIIILLAFKPINFLNKPEYVAAFLGLNLQFLLDYNLNFPTISFLYFLMLSVLLSSDKIEYKKSSKPIKILGVSFTAIFTIVIILQAYGYYYIKKIENNPSSPGYYVSLSRIAPFEHQLYSQIDYPIPTQDYPNFHPYLYVQALNETDPMQQKQLIEKALNLNYYNDLGYHLLYTKVILESDQPEKIQEIDNLYYQLIQDYIELLNVNTHNTITSKNPQYAYQITQLFQPVSNNNWSELENELISVYKTEKNKFQTRFQYNLPDLND